MSRIYITILLCLFLVGSASAAPWIGSTREPDAPKVDRVFNQQRENRINQIRIQRIEEVFTSLQDDEMYNEEEYFNKAAFQSFRSRRTGALQFVSNYLKRPRGTVSGESLEENTDYNVAKRVLRVFPVESRAYLRTLYNRGDSTTKGNIVMVLGKMHDPSGQTVKNWLLEALDDTDVFEEEENVSVGWPLRVCDVAYNQLVLRYTVQDALRTIGCVHEVETRDHHIQILKDLLQ